MVTQETEAVEQEVEVEQVEQPEKVSMDDTIRKAYASIKDRGDEVEETAEAKAERLRDEKGRFAPKSQEAQATTEATEQPEEEVKPEPVVDPNDQPPSSLSGAVKAKWATLDPEVRAEFKKRETDFHKGYQQMRPAAEFGQQMFKAVQPHMQRMQTLGVTPDTAITTLLNADYNLRHGNMAQKRQMLQQIIQDYGITFDDSEPEPASAQPAFDPNQILSQIPQIVQRTLGEQRERDEVERAKQEVEAFAQAHDKYGLMNDWQTAPDGSTFSQFRQMMHSAIQSGLAQDLATAYEVAARAHPKSYQQLLAEQQAKQEQDKKAAEAKRMEEQAKRVSQAKAASSVNVRSRGVVPQAPAKGTMEDTLRAKYREIVG